MKIENSELKNISIIVILSFVFLFFAKLGASSSANMLVVGTLIFLPIVGLVYFSAPIATALVFMSHNLIGQITLSHPGFMVQVLPAGSLLISLLLKRKNEFHLDFLKVTIKRKEFVALCAVLIVFIVAFLIGILSNANMATFDTIKDLFKSSHGGVVDFYPYVFMSRWLVFILIGLLSVRGGAELKNFFLALGFYSTAQLLAVPLPTYNNAFFTVCEGLTGDGLQALNVNRSYLGYLLAISSLTFFTFGIYEKKRFQEIFYYFLGLFFLAMCIVSGSKGAYLALTIAMSFLALKNGKESIVKIFSALFIFLLIFVVVTFPMGCQRSYKYFINSFKATSTSSVSIRADLAQGVYHKSTNINFFKVFFGRGLGASVIKIPVTFLQPNHQAITVMQGSGSHNLFLDFYVDLGILGLSIFIIAIYVLISVFFKNVKKMSDTKLLSVLMSGILIILFVYSVLATAPSMATIQALFVGILFGVGLSMDFNENIH